MSESATDVYFNIAQARRMPSGWPNKLKNFIEKILRKLRVARKDVYARIFWWREIKYRAPGGFQIYLDLRKAVDRAFFVYGFEKNNLEHFSRVIKAGMVVFDIGANIGIYTLTASRLLGSRGRVHAFEPAKWAFRQLERNVGLNFVQMLC